MHITTTPALASIQAGQVLLRDAMQCPYCHARQRCLPGAAAPGGPDSAPRRIQVPRLAPLYRAGEVVRENIYSVRLGSFKHIRADQREQPRITGFYMSGDVLALDSIGLSWHQSSAIALVDSEVCSISYKQMRTFAAHFHALASSSIARAQMMSLQLRRTSAPQKLATFLLDLAAQFRLRGYSAGHYHLPMRHQDIANFLDIAPASISRLLKQFRRQRLIDLSQREIVLCDLGGLAGVAADGMEYTYG
jgi:CRP/FNR family transcriptional regulator, anaerobic regulatory protein